MSKTKKLFSKQKQTKIIPMSDIHTNLNSDEKMKHLGILNIYKLTLYQILNIMFRVKLIQYQKPFIILQKLEHNCYVEHNYSTQYSESNFKEPNIFLRVTKFAISSRGPRTYLE